MTTSRFSLAEARGYAWRAREHRRGGYGAAPKVSPVAAEDRGGHRLGSGRYRTDGSFRWGILADLDVSEAPVGRLWV